MGGFGFYIILCYFCLFIIFFSILLYIFYKIGYVYDFCRISEYWENNSDHFGNTLQMIYIL